ncbi:MAG: tRNA pseudouridine(38-40) synthase TruA [Spirochaetia bacterium]
MKTRSIALTLSYDGTDFRGFQVQPETRTVQSVVEQGLERLLEHPLRIACAGRTDSGVHAAGQVVSFRTDNAGIPADKIAVALNSRLPPDVAAIRSREVPEEFHARYSAVQRTYRYYLYADDVRNPLIDRYAVRVRRLPSLRRLNEYSAELTGTHDFTTFASSRDKSGTRVRTIDHASWHSRGGMLVFEISAKSFMWHMVRSIVGTLTALDAVDAPPAELRHMLQVGDRSLAGTTASAHGLVFYSVCYPAALRVAAPGMDMLGDGNE